MRLVLVLPIVVSVLAAPAPSVGQSPVAPPSALPVGAVLDQGTGTLLLVGGYQDGAAATAETWLWNGTAWRQHSGPGPSARDEPLLGYDRSRHRIILHGGERGLASPTDTWEWNGAGWRLLTETGPPPRRAAGMVYDEHRRRMVLFGGARTDSGEHNDTWEWDGERWTQVTRDGDPGVPTGRALFGLAYDPNRQRVVLFGGVRFVGEQPEVFDDTWEWDGSTWHRIDVPGPLGRDHVSMTYSSALRGVILHAGANPKTGMLGDTWRYDGAWTRIATDGPPRARHRLVSDDRLGQLLLYGGWSPRVGDTPGHRNNDLWRLDGAHWVPIK